MTSGGFVTDVFLFKFSLLAFSHQAKRALNIIQINTENNI